MVVMVSTAGRNRERTVGGVKPHPRAIVPSRPVGSRMRSDLRRRLLHRFPWSPTKCSGALSEANGADAALVKQPSSSEIRLRRSCSPSRDESNDGTHERRGPAGPASASAARGSYDNRFTRVGSRALSGSTAIITES